MVYLFKLIYIIFFLTLNCFLYSKIIINKNVKRKEYLATIILFLILFFGSKYFNELLQNDFYFIPIKKLLILLIFSFSHIILEKFMNYDEKLVYKINEFTNSKINLEKYVPKSNFVFSLLITIFQIISILNPILLSKI